MSDSEPDWSDEAVIEALRNHPWVQPPVIDGIAPVSQDPELFPLGDDQGEGHQLRLFEALAVTPGGRDAMIASARKLLGVSEHPPGSNYNDEVVGWYNTHIAKIGDGPWCDMSVTEEAYDSGNEDAVVGGEGKGFAYVPAHFAWGKLKYGVHTGSVPPPGALVGFRWDGVKGSTVCDHIGLCEKDLGDGTVYTLEGNTNDVFARRHRDLTYISVWFMPAYTTAPATSSAASNAWFLGSA